MNIVELNKIMNIKTSNFSETVDQMLPEYEDALANPYGAGMVGAGYGALGLGAGALAAKYIPGGTGKIIAALAGLALPGLAGMGYEYSNRDNLAEDKVREDLDDIRSDISTAINLRNAPDAYMRSLANQGQEIDKYLGR